MRLSFGPDMKEAVCHFRQPALAHPPNLDVVPANGSVLTRLRDSVRPAARLPALVDSAPEPANLVLERRYRTTIISLLSLPFGKFGMVPDLEGLCQ